jgi:hypothetical protein
MIGLPVGEGFPRMLSENSLIVAELRPVKR